MPVKHADEVPYNPVSAGKDTFIQILISPEEGPHFAMRRFTMKPGGGMPRHTNKGEHEQYVLRAAPASASATKCTKSAPDRWSSSPPACSIGTRTSATRISSSCVWYRTSKTKSASAIDLPREGRRAGPGQILHP